MTDKLPIKDSLDALKQEADALGISYKANVSETWLRNQIEMVNDPSKRALKLHRVLIQPRDPLKRDYDGEIIGVANSEIAQIKRHVPFNKETHVESIILNYLKERELQIFVNEKDSKGRDIRVSKTIPAYMITELEPLSAQELEELKKAQQMREVV